MMLSIHDLQPSDVRHLFCTDPRVADEVSAVNRSLERIDEGVPMWCYLDPRAEPTPRRGDAAREEVAA
jgi:hypothetical protein